MAAAPRAPAPGRGLRAGGWGDRRPRPVHTVAETQTHGVGFGDRAADRGVQQVQLDGFGPGDLEHLADQITEGVGIEALGVPDPELRSGQSEFIVPVHRRKIRHNPFLNLEPHTFNACRRTTPGQQAGNAETNSRRYSASASWSSSKSACPRFQ
ncbi:hypothetical protein [Nocardia brasiliensis]|uniref:hypothetical protein n=1 Tax=Nocardia brasiliensis TaxID=37326 RepID=UPI002455207C|nr:hypothetical protein [Nocardia brasiliensis]